MSFGHAVTDVVNTSLTFHSQVLALLQRGHMQTLAAWWLAHVRSDRYEKDQVIGDYSLTQEIWMAHSQ